MNQPETKWHDLGGCTTGWRERHHPIAVGDHVLHEREGFRSSGTPVPKETFEELVVANEDSAT